MAGLCSGGSLCPRAACITLQELHSHAEHFLVAKTENAVITHSPQFITKLDPVCVDRTKSFCKQLLSLLLKALLSQYQAAEAYNRVLSPTLVVVRGCPVTLGCLSTTSHQKKVFHLSHPAKTEVSREIPPVPTSSALHAAEIRHLNFDTDVQSSHP